MRSHTRADPRTVGRCGCQTDLGKINSFLYPSGQTSYISHSHPFLSPLDTERGGAVLTDVHTAWGSKRL